MAEVSDDTIPQPILNHVKAAIQKTYDELLGLIERNRSDIDDIREEQRTAAAQALLTEGRLLGRMEQMEKTNERYHDEYMAKIGGLEKLLKPLTDLLGTDGAEAADAIGRLVRKDRFVAHLWKEAATSIVRWAAPLLIVALLIGLGILAIDWNDGRVAKQAAAQAAAQPPSNVNVAPQYVLPPGAQITTQPPAVVQTSPIPHR